MRALVSIFAAGLVFALGLGISGMTQADKVIDFLNVAGDWDPSLAFVMVGAIGVHLALFRFILRRPTPLFGERFGIPTAALIDTRLVLGSALFGMGWGLGGFCPGPGIVSLLGLSTEAFIFVAAMLGGMWLFHQVDAITQRGRTHHATSTETSTANRLAA